MIEALNFLLCAFPKYTQTLLTLDGHEGTEKGGGRGRAKNDVACEYWKVPPFMLYAIKDVKGEVRRSSVANSL